MKFKNRKEKQVIPKICESCGEKFMSARSWGQYCSLECRQMGWAQKKIAERKKKCRWIWDVAWRGVFGCV